ncbi:MAG TPA: SDR family oxidoreductase [Polyangiaceae bacterium]|nr:SDR family oxidoreductase [Polyangiaceae bacterium]
MSDLNGKSIVVTGATSGIGRAAAVKLATLGARLTLVGRNQERGSRIEREVRSLGAEARLELVELTQASAMQNIIARTVAEYGRIDAAVLAAAEMPDAQAMVPLARVDDASIERGLLSEVRSTVHALRALLRQLLTREDGDRSIVLVSSVNGLGAAPNAALYSASKAACISLAKAAALDYARSGIRVNALVLGAFETPMLATAFERQSPDGNTEPIRRIYESHIAMGRIGRPEEAADTIAWLCSGSSSYLTGSSVILDGGLTSLAR